MMAYGDHIYAWRHGFAFEHHGIDCGDGTVIEYQGPNKPIRQVTREVFSEGAPIKVVHYEPEECLPSGEVVKRAKQSLGERNYNLVFNNCERFAIWCKTGEDRPGDQVENAAKAIGETFGNIFVWHGLVLAE
jgi:hypothetical protein